MGNFVEILRKEKRIFNGIDVVDCYLIDVWIMTQNLN